MLNFGGVESFGPFLFHAVPAALKLERYFFEELTYKMKLLWAAHKVLFNRILKGKS